MPRSRAPADLQHPAANEPWFRALPATWRADIANHRLADRAREEELARREVRRRWLEAGRMAALFGATDLVCPHRGLSSVLGAIFAGLMLGAIASRADLKRFSTCALGVAAMVLLQWWSRGGLTALHLFVAFPFAMACAYQGYLREERC